MLSHYRHRDWAAALACIEKGRSLDEEGRFTTLYDVYTRRIREFEATPPPDDWAGAYALDSK
jgi:adenylate cyclase